MKRRMILIGEAPAQHGEQAPPFTGPCDTRLKNTIGHDWRKQFAAVNVLDYWPGSAGPKGALFDMAAASIAASAIARTIAATVRNPLVFVCGWRTAQAFRIIGARRFFERREIAPTVGKNIPAYVVPHPSGISHWWNDRENRRHAVWFFKRILEGVEP